MKLSRLSRINILGILMWEGTRQSVQDKALKKIGTRKVYWGNDGVVTIIHVGADYGWSKLCRYQPNADEFDVTRGAKLALLRALGMRK